MRRQLILCRWSTALAPRVLISTALLLFVLLLAARRSVRSGHHCRHFAHCVQSKSLYHLIVVLDGSPSLNRAHRFLRTRHGAPLRGALFGSAAARVPSFLCGVCSLSFECVVNRHYCEPWCPTGTLAPGTIEGAVCVQRQYRQYTGHRHYKGPSPVCGSE